MESKPKNVPITEEMPVEETKKEEAGFLEENPGEKSAMRLLSLLTVSGGIILALIASAASLKGNASTATTIQLSMYLIGVGFGGKLLQKFGEK